MITKQKNILAYAQAHPIRSVVISVFALFTILGSSMSVMYIVAPETAEAIIRGGPACCGDVVIHPDGPGDPGFPGGGGFGGGGGGGGGGNPQPPSCTLSANPNSISTGGTSSLTWTTSRATTAVIDNSIGSVSIGSGLTSVSPPSSTTYTMTVSGIGGSAICSADITVIPVVLPVIPSCTLTVDPSSVTLGDSASIAWTTTNGATFNINAGIGSATPVAGGNTPVTPSLVGSYTYIGVVTSSTGNTATCTDTLIVNPVVVTAPSCTLSATPEIILPGGSSDLTWTTTNGSTFSIDNSVGSVTPVAGGSESVSPTTSTTYTGTVTDSLGVTASCDATVTVTVNPPAPSCTLGIAPDPITLGDSTTITWTTTNGATFSIDNSVGSVTPVAGGDTSITPATVGLHTYIGTVVNAAGDTETCTDTVTVNPVITGFSCALSINPGSIRTGSSATMDWTTSDAVSFEINGATRDLNGTESLSPVGVQTYTYTGIATNAAGETTQCIDTLQVTGGSGGGSISCSMSFSKSSIRSGETSQLQWTTSRADSAEIDRLGVVALSGDETITQTGVGSYEYVLTAQRGTDTAICRATLQVTGGSGGCVTNCGGGSNQPRITIDFLKNPVEQPLAFITLSQIPYTGLELSTLGTIIYWLFLTVWSGAIAYLVLFKVLPYTGRKLVEIGGEVSNAVHATEEGTIEVRMNDEIEEIGFAPKVGDEMLSVEDIVRGLSRMHQEPRVVAPAVEVEEEPESHDADIATEMELPPVASQKVPVFEGDELRLLSALMSGDRDASFGVLRRTVRNGSRPDLLIEKVLVSLDSAYRARIEGSVCSEDVRRMCSVCDTALLEEVIGALASAVDTTYSQSQVGVKLAIARAHAVIERG